jgi:hypothetical protein
MFIRERLEELDPPVSLSFSSGLFVLNTYNLQAILPELFFMGLIQERKFADMVNEDISQNREIRIQRRDLAILGPKGSTKSLQCRWRGELLDFIVRLIGYEFSFQICSAGGDSQYTQSVVVGQKQPNKRLGRSQCSCFPDKIPFSPFFEDSAWFNSARLSSAVDILCIPRFAGGSLAGGAAAAAAAACGELESAVMASLAHTG